MSTGARLASVPQVLSRVLGLACGLVTTDKRDTVHPRKEMHKGPNRHMAGTNTIELQVSESRFWLSRLEFNPAQYRHLSPGRPRKVEVSCCVSRFYFSRCSSCSR